MSDKIVLISGANSGIGLASAVKFAQNNYKVYILCRNKEKAERACKDIKDKSNNNDVDYYLADLSSKESIAQSCEQIKSEVKKIDILINNAGAIFGKRILSNDALEMTFGLNHMGYFWLTHHLLDLVRFGAEKRIINVSSMAHHFVKKIPFDDLQLEHETYKQFRAYSMSKLFNVYFTKKIASLLEMEGITVNCLHPGTIYSGFGQSGSPFFKKLIRIGGPLLGKPDTAAKTIYWMGTEASLKSTTGQYFAHMKSARLSKLARNEEAMEKIWSKTLNLARINHFGKTK